MSNKLNCIEEVSTNILQCHSIFFFSRSLPTIILAECVMIYMEGEKSTALLRWFSEHLSACAFINYEQVSL